MEKQEGIDMRYKGSEAHRRIKAPDPSKAALIVIDMQEYFRDIVHHMLPVLQRVIQSARSAGIPVVYTQHVHKGPEDGGMVGEWWGGSLILDGSAEGALLPEVGITKEDKLIKKNVYSAFLKSDLEEYLKGLGRTEVIITGVMTNLCCETTARDAFGRNFRVYFSSDATADASPEFHEATLRNMNYGFAYVVDESSLKFSA